MLSDAFYHILPAETDYDQEKKKRIGHTVLQPTNLGTEHTDMQQDAAAPLFIGVWLQIGLGWCWGCCTTGGRCKEMEATQGIRGDHCTWPKAS